MTVGASAPVRYERERAELRDVLASSTFARAPRLARMLSYLCEKTFSGQTAQVKEYSIGVEVFGRGQSFDQNTDSIVRVEANRLRRHLADYYACSGSSHPLHIEIPLGQYVPEFVQVQSVAEAGPARRLVHGPLFRKRRWRQIMVAGSLAALVIAITALWVLLRPAKVLAPAANQPRPGETNLDLQIGPPGGEEVRILCGGTRSLVDHAGKLWNADIWYSGGSAVTSDVRHISRTQDPAFYRTSRQGVFRYDIPLKPAIYEMHLHFAETVYGPESTGMGGEGNRLMSVRANGRALMTRFDIAADAGASRTADVKIFTDLGPDRDGSLHLEFWAERGIAMLSAIEILPGIPAKIRPIRILARQTPYYSNDSQWWSPDNYFEGGQLTTYTTAVAGTDDPEMYESERWGNFTYAIPVSPGKYSVWLHFAARHGDWPPTAGQLPHIFNVFCNGREIVSQFDPLRESRRGDVAVRKAAGIEPNAQGKLVLSFVSVEGYATVSGIEVIPQ